MSIALLAVVLVLLASHYFPASAGLRRLPVVAGIWDGWIGQLNLATPTSWLGSLLRVGVPALLLLWLQWALHGSWFGLLSLLLGVVVLFACWGPRDLDRDVADALDETRGAEHDEAARALRLPDASQPWQGVAPALFHAGLERWFGVLFWFVVLGPAGALLFRLTRIAMKPDIAAQAPLAQIDRCLRWPVAQLMTLALALAAHFDRVAEAWRRWHQQHPLSPWGEEPGFLAAAVVASIDLGEAAREEVEAEQEPSVLADDDPALEQAIERHAQEAIRSDPHAVALGAAHGLLWRVLVVWLLVLALTVIAGITG